MVDPDEVLRTLEDEAALEDVLGLPLAILYKHSPACWQSFRAIGHVRRFALEAGSPPVWMLDVIRQRPLARTVSERLSVRHESPQVLVVRAGDLSWHASHGSVRYEKVRDAVERARNGG